MFENVALPLFELNVVISKLFAKEPFARHLGNEKRVIEADH